jgi:hypothetical protein
MRWTRQRRARKRPSQGGRQTRERSGDARTTGAELPSLKLRRDWYQARRAAFSSGGADGEVVWS